MADDFYLFANCNFVPDKYGDVRIHPSSLPTKLPLPNLGIAQQWQAAYDDLAVYVHSSEHTTKSYYFGIPLDYAHDFSKTTSMFAFEIYSSRDVSPPLPLISNASVTIKPPIPPLPSLYTPLTP